MSEIATSTNEVSGSYDDNPNVTQPIGQAPAQGQDDMPWLLRDKFKGETTDDIVRQQAMAYPELQKKMGEWWGAPKEGDYDVAALKEYGIDPTDPILTGMKATFKEMGLSNQAIKKLAASYEDSLKGMGRKMEEDLKQAMTPDLVQAAARVEGWMGKFSKAEQETMKGWLQTPEDFKMLNTMIAMNPTPTNNLPAQGAMYGHRYETAKQVEREKIDNFEKYKKDPAYRADVAQRYRDAVTREVKG